MTCEKYFDLIEDLLEGELDEHLAEKVESHVFACQECRERYETRWRAKEIYSQYLFDAEPPSDSWINFQVRLIEEKEKSPENSIIPATPSRDRKRMFVFSFSPALAAGAALLLIFGIGFVWLKTPMADKSNDKYVAVTEAGDSQTPPQFDESDQKQATNSEAKTVAVATDDIAKNNNLLSKTPFAIETAKIKQKTVYLSDKMKSASKTRPNEEKRLSELQARNLETEIAGQIEKVELLLRSFRNARANETVAGFDVEYEKGQARKLLDKNAQLRRDAENYGISYAEELLSQVEPYLLDIANLEINPAPDKVLDIKERVISRNIIASLQVYSRDEAQ